MGRFGDECIRVRFTDISVIDKAAELKCNASLFKFVSELNKNKTQLKPITIKEAKV